MNRLTLSWFALFVALSLAASPAHVTSSNATMTGVWGYFFGSSIGQFTADGLSNITNGTHTTSSAGVISTQTFTGTYSIRETGVRPGLYQAASIRRVSFGSLLAILI